MIKLSVVNKQIRNENYFAMLFLIVLPVIAVPVQAARFNNAFEPVEEQDVREPVARTAPLSQVEQPRAIEFGGSLSLSQAEKIALDNDSLAKKLESESISMHEKGVAASSWPDPKLKLGLMNVPVDTYDFAQEPMTQQVIGIQQMLPSFNLTGNMGEQMMFKGKAMSFKALNQRREVLRGVRKAWLNVYKQHHAYEILTKSETLFNQLVNITKSKYRQGGGNQQNVVRAQLELSLLQDKKINIMAMKEMAMSDLNKWLGSSHASRQLDLDSLAIPDIRNEAELQLLVDRHPALKAAIEAGNAAQSGVNVAKSRYKPAVMVDLTYGKRDFEMPSGEIAADFISLMFMVDMPFFTSKRQDKWLSASEKEYNAAQYFINERRKQLKRLLDMEYVKWQRLTERLQHYRGSVLPQSGQNAEAALNAYRSQVTDFNPLMRARLMEFKNKLQALNLLVARATAQVNLLYLVGDGV